jgi:hypothetical protein
MKTGSRACLHCGSNEEPRGDLRMTDGKRRLPVQQSKLRLRSGQAEFRNLVFEEILSLLQRHGIEKHNLVKDDFERLFTMAGREFEVFAETPCQLWEEARRVETSF